VDTEREDTGWENGGGDFVLREIFREEEMRRVGCESEGGKPRPDRFAAGQ
jgi:hypothetical protein